MFMKTVFCTVAILSSVFVFAQSPATGKTPSTTTNTPPSGNTPKTANETRTQTQPQIDIFSLGKLWEKEATVLKQKFGIKDNDPNSPKKPEPVQQAIDPELFKKMKGVELMGDASFVKSMAENSNIEEATMISRNWFKQLAAVLEKIAVCKSDIEGVIECGRQDRFEPLALSFSKQWQEVVKLLLKPEKLSDGQIKKLREERHRREGNSK